MIERHAERVQESPQRAYLVLDVAQRLGGRDLEHAAAKSHQVRQPGMRADRHAELGCLRDRVPHGHRIAGVEPAGDTGRW